MCVHARARRIISTHKILRFLNTVLMIAICTDSAANYCTYYCYLYRLRNCIPVLSHVSPLEKREAVSQLPVSLKISKLLVFEAAKLFPV